MLAQWLREREQRKRQEAAERIRQEVNQEWLAWYERMQAAQREGKPFAEPPPSAAHPDDSRRK